MLRVGQASIDAKLRRPVGRRILDFLFGYDFFISYAWTDGGTYAQKLARALDAAGFEVFLDRAHFAAGDHWKAVGSWTLRRTGQLILVGTPGARSSAPVLHEIEIFSTTGRRIVPIEFGGSLAASDLPPAMAALLPPEMLRIPESIAALSSEPSPEVLEAIQRTFALVRQDRRRLRALGSVAALLAVLALGATASAFWAQENAREAALQRDEAQTQRATARRQEVIATEQRDEAERQRAAARRQEVIATEQRDEAESQRAAARRQEVIATEQRDLAEQRLTQARTAISENLIDLGKLELSGGEHGASSAMAIAYGYAADQVAPSARVPALVRQALQNVPVWSELNLGKESWDILDKDASSDDRVGASDDLQLVVLASKDRSRLELVEVDTGRVIGARVLNAQESVVAGERVAGNWLVLAGARTGSDSFDAEVIDIRARDLSRVALKARVRAIACATRAASCSYVTEAGRIVQWRVDGAMSVEVAPAPGPLRLFVDPVGELTALVSGHGERLHVARRGSGKLLDIAAPQATAGKDLARGREQTGVVHFLPGAGKLLYHHRGDIEIVDLARATREPLPRPSSGLPALRVDVAGQADTFVVHWGESFGKDYQLELVRTASSGSAKSLSIERKVVSAGSANSGRIVAFSLSPSGNYLVLARAEGGGNRTIAGWLESYSLTDSNQRWKSHEVMSIGGRQVVRLEHSSASDRILVWHGENAGASVLRLRVGAQDPRTDVPLVQLSRRLPEDLAARFTARALTSPDGHHAFVRYADLDLRRYELATGRELRISLANDPGALLAASSWRGHDLLCGSRGISLQRANRQVRWIPAPQLLSRCSILGEQILVRTPSGFGVLDLAAGSRVRRLEGLDENTTWAMLRSSAAGTVALMGLAADGSFFQRNWRWSDADVLKEQVTARSHISTPPLTADESLDEGRVSWWVTGEQVFRVDQLARFRSVLRIFDWRTGQRSRNLLPPAQGWPERIEHLVGYFTTSKGVGSLVFQGGGCPEASGTAACIYIATWPDGAGPAQLKVAGTNGNAIELVPVDGVDIPHILLWDGGEVRWLSADDGRLIHSIKLERPREYNTPVPPFPALSKGTDNRWRLASDEAVHRVYRRMLLGGLDDSREVTRVHLPNSVAARTRGLN